MNSIDSVSVTAAHPAFRAKGINRKELYAFMDESNKIAMDMLNKERPLEEKEALLRDSLFKFNDNYFSKIIERGKTAIEHMMLPFRKDEYEKWIINEVNAGHIDADHATALLAHHGIIKSLANKFLK